MMRNILISLIVLMLVQSTAHAAQTTITPSISARTTYTSNVNRVPDDRDPQDDLITTISPGVSLSVLGKNSDLTAAYVASRVFYKESTDNTFWRHRFSLSGNSQLTKNSNFNIGGSYLRTEDPADTDDVDFTDTGGRFLREIYTADAGISYQFAKRGTISLGAGFGENQYENPNSEDSRNYRASLGVSYGFLSQWTASLDLGYRYGEFEVTDNFDNFTGSVSLAYQINKRMSAYVTYQLTSYLSELDDNRDDADRVHDISAGFDYSIATDMNFNAQVGYFVRKLPDQDDESDTYANLSFTKSYKQGSISVSGGSGYDYTYFRAENLGFNYFYFANLRGNYSFSQRLSGNAYLGYRRNEYDRDNDTRDNYIAGCGISYQLLRWLSLGAGYDVRFYKPEEDSEEYTDQRVFISLTASKDYLIWH